MKLTKKDYQNALEIWLCFFYSKNQESYREYIEAKIKELEQPEKLMYKCIKLPPANNESIKIGNLYSNSYCIAGFYLADLPNHFQLVEPEPEPEKITWHELITLIEGFKRKTNLPQGFYIEIKKILEQIKTDHL